MLRSVQGIVLRSMDYGEGNKIISLFTPELGKVGVMARGAKKVKSRHAAVTQLFTYGDFVFFKTRGQMGSLNSAEIIEAHHALREDLHMSAHASYLAEMTDRMLGDEEGSTYLFEQLKAGLMAIEEGKDMQIVVHLYEMKMFELAGYLPVTDACVSCGETSDITHFSPSMGGTLCSRCRYKDTVAIRVGEGALKLLKLFPRMDMRRLGAVQVKDETKAQLKTCMRTYMDIHIGVKWKSRDFIEQMEKYNI
ncbi:DNA repair protein RecO [Paenibacillus sp. CGMCC 1.16610]|uniref:DNA repair protein RecO n=1 Tax=Paenibacillus anseongense TaxID=2682845 RepID=A0ABW9UBA5_9BACL|nr:MULTISPECIES: DNA repair protein RecO [Paenibacillus]MBA2938131.1 DNA repair protein RecO [Paenibacillus sp. CGMCC 1.16610]MVQ37188.1 DNA repair protein RecO [Paenibacillus anseongense]